MKRKWNVSNQQTRRKCAEEVLARINEQDGSAFGLLAAEDIIDIVAQNIGPDIYNLAIKDVSKLVQERLEVLELGIDLLRNIS